MKVALKSWIKLSKKWVLIEKCDELKLMCSTSFASNSFKKFEMFSQTTREQDFLPKNAEVAD